jgi:hypothetical protein
MGSLTGQTADQISLVRTAPSGKGIDPAEDAGCTADRRGITTYITQLN